MSELRLITGNSNRPLAQDIARYIGVNLAECEVKRFSDGEIFVQINENIRGADVFIIQSTNAPADNIMELLMLIEASRRASAARITAVIPYFGYARQDRKDRPRVAIAAKLAANLITTAGADRIITMDLHASQIQGFFDLPHDHLYSTRVFKDLVSNIGCKSLVIVSPDVGSIKMARAFAKHCKADLAIIDKRRPAPNLSEVVNIIGEVEGKNIIIRDDMVDTAGTLCEAASAMAEAGALEIMAICTHAVLSGNAIERINNSPIKKIFISNSIDVEKKKLSDKFHIMSCANLFGEAIMRISGEKSVSSLFSDFPD
ncbi:MAG: ribose-phosphate diphosphokinase [Candidatus Zixiibacteriota bacterium]|nr:MAG: ribose-phosphate diphosphokinase [candidate division Zixibacteria bacterium]HDL04148.1 ribose-phosphate pyrophosphokinase [candidate division Zixibacteria bacterium]